MEETKSILHELYVYSEWKPEPEYIQKSDSIIPENISAIWRWMNFLGPKKSLIDSVTAHIEKHQKWHIALGDEGKVIAVLTDNILEIRTKRSEYATIAARTTVSRDAYPQWRKLVWSPDCSFVVIAYGNGVVSFFDLTASNLFNIPIDCSRPGGMECTDNTHAVADIIFMPLRVKDTKWNWEVLIVTYSGKLRGYLVSQTEGFKLHHTFKFAGGVSALTYCDAHATLYVAGVPKGPCKDPTSPLSAGLTAWRILNEEPFYTLSVVSDELEAQLANERFSFIYPFGYNSNMAFIVLMCLSPDGSSLACAHCDGGVSLWRLPQLRAKRRPESSDPSPAQPCDLNWWTNQEIILARFNGAVTVCDIETLKNVLGKKPEMFQGSPQVTRAYDGTFMVLECESNILPAKKSRSDESMEVVKIETDSAETMLDVTKELIKSVLYAITDMETFQPRPRRITVMSRVYRLLGVKSTTPTELFSRKIENGLYNDALTLAETFNLDSDLVYQQQWRKNPVSADAIEKYLSKVSKKIWAVHQCVDRLPETLPAAKELLQFGLTLTNDEILNEINKDREEPITDSEDITLEDLNAYTSELLRCRHVMLFYKERLILYESILRCEKSSYDMREYFALRSGSVERAAVSLARAGRVAALSCVWAHVATPRRTTVLRRLPETLNPLEYQHLLPARQAFDWFDTREPPHVPDVEVLRDWCRKDIFRSIWSSNWSEDTTPDTETLTETATDTDDITKWYDMRAREIEERSGLVSHALTLVTLATVGAGIEGLDHIMFHLLTLDTLIYDINVEGVTLVELEKMSNLETCTLLMKMSTPLTFVSDLKQFVIPYLKRYEKLTNRSHACLSGLTDYLESISVDDLSSILLVLQSPLQFECDVRTHLELAERCLFAHAGTDQLDKACDVLDTILKETDGSISSSELVRRVTEVERLVSASSRLAWRGVRVPPRDLRQLCQEPRQVHNLLTRLARSIATGEEKPTHIEWEKLFKDMLELQATLFTCITREQLYEIHASALLTSGDAASIRLAGEVITCSLEGRARGNVQLVSYARSVEIVSSAAKEYFNSASTLNDPALELAKCCLMLIKDGNVEIQLELDLIFALQILGSFGLSILPIQVRLCEDKMSLIEDCIKSDPNAYLASHKLLKLATLLRVAGDDERTREGQVLQLICARALASDGGGAAAGEAARRLATLRHAAAAPLLAAAARATRAHLDRVHRHQLYAAALAYIAPAQLSSTIRDRLGLELEGLHQMGIAVRENKKLAERCPSTDDEFADAITTPIIEKKDLVAPPTKQPEKKKPLFNYLLDTIQNKFSVSDAKAASAEPTERTVHCQEFYRSLYPEHNISNAYYSYNGFSVPDALGQAGVGQNVLKWYYIQNCLENGTSTEMETEVVHKCAEEFLYKDTALSVACMLRATEAPGARHLSDTHVSCALYATLIKCNCAELRDYVYLTKPAVMARTTLKQKNASEEQLKLIQECIERLTGMGEVESLRDLGYTVNGLLFNADDDYRREIIYRVARSGQESHVTRALSLAHKYSLDPLDVWLQHAAASLQTPSSAPPRAPPHSSSATSPHRRIRETLWPEINGSEHNALINYFAILKSVDEKTPIGALTPTEHIKLLKKAKAASSELDYKLLVEHPTAEQFTSHMLNIIKPENVGMVTKFLRSLPPAFKIPVSVNTVYTKWLTKYFFSVPMNASTKKWMQQYRQCSSYFNKLSKDDLMQFVADTCFTDEAIERVPSGTRNLMIMQAVDYCQQEQENDFKFNKNEQSWGQVGQELARWARFLENFHSTTVQNLIENSNVPRNEIWPSLEKSHGAGEQVLKCCAALVLAHELRAHVLTSLLHCVHVDSTVDHVFQHILRDMLHDSDSTQTFCTRLAQYHKDGIKFSEDLLERTLEKATSFGLPPHKQIGLLSLSQRARVHDSDDMMKIADFSAELFRNEWTQSEHKDYANQLTGAYLMSEGGRREAFTKFLQLSEAWQQKKVLVDVLNCWPPTRNNDSKSLHSEYLKSLLSGHGDQKENLVLIKLLLRRPVLVDEEIDWLAENVPAESVLNTIWVMLLSKCDHRKENISNLMLQHKEYLQKQEDIEDDLIKELLENKMFIRLVGTPLYSHVINYIITMEIPGEQLEPTMYTTQWAINELVKANFIAEAGHLQLMTMRVPTALRGFTQSVMYYKNILTKK